MVLTSTIVIAVEQAPKRWLLPAPLFLKGVPVVSYLSERLSKISKCSDPRSFQTMPVC